MAAQPWQGPGASVCQPQNNAVLVLSRAGLCPTERGRCPAAAATADATSPTLALAKLPGHSRATHGVCSAGPAACHQMAVQS